MPGYKRKFKGKKKSYKKRKGKKLGAIGLAKLQNGVRKYFSETRATGLHNPTVDHIGIYSITAPGNGLLTTNNRAAFGEVYNIQGILDTPGGTADLGLPLEQTGLGYHVFNHNVNMTLRNVEKDPCYVTIYLLTNIHKLEQEITAEPTTLNNTIGLLYRDLVQGWDKFTLAANFTNAGAASTFIPFGRYGAAGGYNVNDHAVEIVTPAAATTGTQDLVISSQYLNLKNSIGFLKNWKIVKFSKRKMQPGDDWALKFKVPARTYTSDKYQRNEIVANYNPANSLLTTGIIALPGEVRVPLVFVQGMTGYAAANPNIYNWMDTNIACQIIQKCSVLPININGHNQVMRIETDVQQTEANLRGPSDFAAAAGD